MTAHSTLGASSASRWMSCPGSVAVAAAAPPSRPSVYAAQGTGAHSLAEQCLTQDMAPLEARAIYTGGTITIDGFEVTIDDEMLAAVEAYLDVIRPLAEVSDFSATEQTVTLDAYWRPGRPPVPMFGTIDFVGYQRAARRLSIVDLKFGAGVFVSHIDNPQLLYYGAGALTLLANVEPTTPIEVELIIVQPRVSGAPPVRRQILPAIDISLWVENTLKPAVARTQEIDAALVVGDHCRWCPGQLICPALHDVKLRAAQTAFGSVNDTEVSDDDLARYLDDIAPLELWIDAVRTAATERLEAGGTIPGWQLMPTRPRRVWGDEAALVETLTARGVVSEAIYERSLYSPAQMQKRLASDVWKAAQRFIESRSSGVKLGRIEFAAVSEEEASRG